VQVRVILVVMLVVVVVKTLMTMMAMMLLLLLLMMMTINMTITMAKITSISSPLHLKFNRLSMMLGNTISNSSGCTIHTFFNSVPFPSNIASIDGKGHVTWRIDTPTNLPLSSAVHSSTFAIPQPLPSLSPGLNDLAFALHLHHHLPHFPPPKYLMTPLLLPCVPLRAFYYPLPLAHPRIVVVDIDGAALASLHLHHPPIPSRHSHPFRHRWSRAAHIW
jgi:hypothetical protein